MERTMTGVQLNRHLFRSLFLLVVLVIFLATGVAVGWAKQGKEILVGVAPYGPTFQQAIAAVGGRNQTLIVPAGTYPIKGNFTVPANIDLRVLKGAVFSIAPGATLTLKGPLEAGSYPIFSWYGTGKIAIGSSDVCREVNARWFGTDPTGVADSTAAIQMALDSVYTNDVTPVPVGTIFLQKGTYSISKRIHLHVNEDLVGDYSPPNPTTIKPVGAFPSTKNIGYAAFSYGYPSRSIVSPLPHAPVLENINIDLSAIPLNTEICGIWINKRGRRACFRNISIEGNHGYNSDKSAGAQIGIKLSHWEYDDSGKVITPKIQNNDNTMLFEHITGWHLNYGIYVEPNTDAELQTFRGCIFSACNIDVVYGGFQSVFEDCGFEPVCRELKNRPVGGGGYNPRFIYLGSLGLVLRDNYWDGGAGSILLWSECSSNAYGTPYADYTFEGFNAGYKGDAGHSPNITNVVAGDKPGCTVTGARQLTVPGVNVLTVPFWLRTGRYIWTETSHRTGGDVRYNYRIDSVKYDGTKSIINLDPHIGPALDAATTHFYCQLIPPLMGNERSWYNTNLRSLNVDSLTVGITTPNGSPAGSGAGTALSRIKKTTYHYDVGTIGPGQEVEKYFTNKDSIVHGVVYAFGMSFHLPPNIVIRYGRQQGSAVYFSIRNDPIYIGNGRWIKESGSLWYAAIDPSNDPEWLYYDFVKATKVTNKANLNGPNKWWHDPEKKRIYLHSADNPNHHQILVGFAWTPGKKDWYVLSIK
jgi:hypothetical protein